AGGRRRGATGRARPAPPAAGVAAAKAADTGKAADAAKAAAMRPRDARQTRFAQSFAQIVGVLMRDANFRKMRIADLEWLVLPPVMAGQFRLAQAPSPLARGKGQQGGQEGGVLVPVA